MLAIVDDGRVYLKVGDETRSHYEEAGMQPFRPNPRQMLKTYYEVPPDVLGDAPAFAASVGEGVRAARPQ